MLVGVGTGLPEIFVHLAQAATTPLLEEKKDDKPTRDSAAAVQSRIGSQEDQINRHKEIESAEDRTFDTDWPDKVNIGSQYAKDRQELFYRLAELQKM